MKKAPKYNLRAFLFFNIFWRRVRDSNPRTCYSQQFSRLPQSTTLPTLRGQKYKSDQHLQNQNKLFFLFRFRALKASVLFFYLRVFLVKVSCTGSCLKELKRGFATLILFLERSMLALNSNPIRIMKEFK